MRILVTAFDPFGGETRNPAQEVLARLPQIINGADIIPLVVPTVFWQSLDAALEAIRTARTRWYV